jgi:hypothetical protein
MFTACDPPVLIGGIDIAGFHENAGNADRTVRSYARQGRYPVNNSVTSTHPIPVTEIEKCV